MFPCSVWNIFEKLYGKGVIMDRRQQKTRAAVFRAFSTLLSEKTKDDLLKALCKELFDHIISSAADCTHTHGLYSSGNAPESVFCHLLQHLQEDENNILELLSCESSEIFLRYFKDSLNELIQDQFVDQNRKTNTGIPRDFLVNHISGSFVEMVLWWIKGRRKQAPEELDRYFRAVIEPIL